MNPRDKRDSRKLLDFLHARDRKTIEQEELISELNALTGRSHAEGKALIELCDGQGWLTGVAARFTGKIWAINDEGELARLQL
jgi:hypothetical protein